MEEKGFPAAQQKLIHKGKILADDKLLSETSYKEGEFIVVMLSKKYKKKGKAAVASKMEEE